MKMGQTDKGTQTFLSEIEPTSLFDMPVAMYTDHDIREHHVGIPGYSTPSPGLSRSGRALPQTRMSETHKGAQTFLSEIKQGSQTFLSEARPTSLFDMPVAVYTDHDIREHHVGIPGYSTALLGLSKSRRALPQTGMSETLRTTLWEQFRRTGQ